MNTIEMLNLINSVIEETVTDLYDSLEVRAAAQLAAAKMFEKCRQMHNSENGEG